MLNIWMSELTEEGEDVKCMLSTWVSELTEEGERMMNVGHLDVRTDEGVRTDRRRCEHMNCMHVEYLDVRTDRRRRRREVHVEYLGVRTDRRR